MIIVCLFFFFQAEDGIRDVLGSRGLGDVYKDRTTGVSNPVRYPRFRASASISDSSDAFAIGVLCDIYAFHRYTTHSSDGIGILALRFQRQPP